MQMAGPWAVNAPPDQASAIGVLRAAVAAGIDHIDTAQYYGPDVVNDLIREALYPYPGDLAIVSKVGVFRDTGRDARQLREGIEDNLRSLRVGQLAAVNPRRPSPGRPDARFDDQLAAMVQARDEGLIAGCRPEQRQSRTAPARRGPHRDRLRAEHVPPRRPGLGPARSRRPRREPMPWRLGCGHRERGRRG